MSVKPSPPIKAVLDHYYQQIDWLYTLITDPGGARYFLDKSPAARWRELQDQLARTADFLEFAGNPHHRFKAIHVAGTSGKGSVVAMMAAILQRCSLRVGAHVSPYLQVCNEKLSLNGRLIAPSELSQLIAALKTLHADWVEAGRAYADLRYSEAWVILTYLWLARQKVDWAVIETGLGGRFDPTNVLASKLAVITNVEFDHEKTLGMELGSIAYHKAGIIKPGCVAVTAERNPVALEVIEAEAARCNSRLYRLDRDFSFTVQAQPPETTISIETPFRTYRNVKIAAPGRFQVNNAALAVAALDILSETEALPLTETAVKAALRQFTFPGRLEMIQKRPLVILDGAHNPHKMQALVDSWQTLYPGRPTAVILGMIELKDVETIITILATITRRFLVTAPTVFGKPALPAGQLAQIVSELVPGAEIHQVGDIEAGLALAQQLLDPDEALLITGSLYLVGEARNHWRPKEKLLESLEFQHFV